MIKALAIALPFVAVGTAVTTGHLPLPAALSGTSPAIGLAQAADAATMFQMPTIASPQVTSSSCAAKATTKLSATTTSVKQLCIADGKNLVNGGKVSNFVMADIVAKNYGPLLRGSAVPGLQVLRVNATGARADDVLGLGIVNVSNGIGNAVFRDLVWIGDPNSPAINSDDAWAAIALKGKDADDVGTFEISNFDFENLYMANGSNYRNVDGISTEGGYSGTIKNGRVINASDACLDIKGDVSVDNVYLSGCREGMKIWRSQKHGMVELGTNTTAGIIGKGQPGDPRRIDIDVLVASGDPKIPLLRAEEGPVTLHIGRLVAKPTQVLNSSTSYAGSEVIVDQRVDS